MYDNARGMMETAQAKLTSYPVRQTLRERLMEQKQTLEDHLKNINDALAFMDTNPSFETFHNTISKAGF